MAQRQMMAVSYVAPGVVYVNTSATQAREEMTPVVYINEPNITPPRSFGLIIS